MKRLACTGMLALAASGCLAPRGPSRPSPPAGQAPEPPRPQVAAYLFNSSEVWSVAFSPDGGMLASALSGRRDNREFGEVLLWNPRTGVLLRTLDEGSNPVASVAFSPDGGYPPGGRVLLAAAGNQVSLWDPKDGLRRQTLPVEQPSGIIAVFSRDGKTLAVISGGDAQLWDVSNPARQARLRLTIRASGDPERIRCVACSPDGKLIALGKSGGSIALHELETGRPRRALRGAAAEVFSLAFSPDGKRIASASSSAKDQSRSDEAQLWDAQTSKRLRRFAADNVVRCVAFSPEGSILASGAGGPLNPPGAVNLYDAQTGRLRQRLALKGLLWVKSVAFSPDGAVLAAGGAIVNSKGMVGCVCLWDARAGRFLRTLPPGPGEPRRPDGQSRPDDAP